MVAPEVVILELVTLLITGAVPSAVVKLKSLDVAKFPAASRDFTR
jgi:hypothetical protein